MGWRNYCAIIFGWHCSRMSLLSHIFFLHSRPSWCFPCYYVFRAFVVYVPSYCAFLLTWFAFMSCLPSCLIWLLGRLISYYYFNRFVFIFFFLSALCNCSLCSTNLFSSINLVIRFFFYLLNDNAFFQLSNQFIANSFSQIWGHASKGKSCASVERNGSYFCCPFFIKGILIDFMYIRSKQCCTSDRANFLSDDFHHPSRHTKSFQRLYDVVCLLGLYIKYYIQEKCKYLFLWEMNMRFPPFSYQEYMISSYDIIGFSN